MGSGTTTQYVDTKFVSMIQTATGVAPVRIHATSTAAVLTAADLDNEDVVIVEGLQRAYSATEADVLASWVNAGHGLVLLNGFIADPSRAATFATSYSVIYESTLLQASGLGYVSTFSYPPITSGVSSLPIEGGYGMTTTDPNASVFATYSTTQTIGLALAHGSGRVALWGDDWVVADSQIDRADSGGAYPDQTFWTNVLTWVSN
jgi:hypothetical protein